MTAGPHRFAKKPTGGFPVGLPLIQDSLRPGAPSRGEAGPGHRGQLPAARLGASSRPPTEKATPSLPASVPARRIAGTTNNSVQRPLARWLGKGRTTTRWRLPPEAPCARMVVNRRSPIRSRGERRGGRRRFPRGPALSLRNETGPGSKKGQAPFAGTALRVLRTKGACPVFGPGNYPSSGLAKPRPCCPILFSGLAGPPGQGLTSIR